MLRRSLLALVVGGLVAFSGCGSDDENTATPAQDDAAKAAVLVTADCGKDIIVEKTEVAPENAMRALDRVADIETDAGGKFVTAIEGREQDTDNRLAWLFYVDGKMAQKGATEITLKAGDVEWWDLHDYEQECATVPDAAR